MSLAIVRAGVSTSVQSVPRNSSRRFGVSGGGALDLLALRFLNLLVGNQDEAAVLEITAGTVRLAVKESRLVAWSGGGYEVRAGDRALPPGHTALIQPGDELSITGPGKGFRGWIAISGGLEVPIVIGSRSTDLRGQFGGWQGRALKDGDVLPLGRNSERSAHLIGTLLGKSVASWTAPFDWTSPHAYPPVLHFVRGKEWELFDRDSQDCFTSTTFAVAPETDRMGIRLKGTVLRRVKNEDLVSEAVAPGAIQVPPDGQAILLLGDCQTIGGYPKLAHVITADLPRAAQLRPGDHVIFQEVTLADAYARLGQTERDLAKFRIGLELTRT